jgi:hypothetical protein
VQGLGGVAILAGIFVARPRPQFHEEVAMLRGRSAGHFPLAIAVASMGAAIIVSSGARAAGVVQPIEVQAANFELAAEGATPSLAPGSLDGTGCTMGSEGGDAKIRMSL